MNSIASGQVELLQHHANLNHIKFDMHMLRSRRAGRIEYPNDEALAGRPLYMPEVSHAGGTAPPDWQVSSPLNQYLGCPQVSCLHPYRNFGRDVVNGTRGSPLVHDADVPSKNKVTSERYDLPFGSLRQMRPLRGAHVEEDSL